jgi:hypothetical protein
MFGNRAIQLNLVKKNKETAVDSTIDFAALDTFVKSQVKYIAITVVCVFVAKAAIAGVAKALTSQIPQPK